MRQHKESATINGQYIRNSSSAGYAPKTEIGVIPDSTPYILELDEKIASGSTITATIDGSPAEVIPYTVTPNAGQVAIDRTRGYCKYNLADAGKDTTVAFVPTGTVATAAKLEAMIPTGESVQITVGSQVLTFENGSLVSVDPV